MKSLTLRIALCGAAVVVALAGCDTQTPCEARPTTMVTQPDGTVACFEADGELCDDDPCDTDDDAVKPSKKPATKPASTPKPRTSRR